MQARGALAETHRPGRSSGRGCWVNVDQSKSERGPLGRAVSPWRTRGRRRLIGPAGLPIGAAGSAARDRESATVRCSAAGAIATAGAFAFRAAIAATEPAAADEVEPGPESMS